MMHVNTPWIGLAAMLFMFVLPYLPNRLFEGPRTIKHYPRKHVCAVCGALWADGHVCASSPDSDRDNELLHGKIWRTSTSTALERRPPQLHETDE